MFSRNFSWTSRDRPWPWRSLRWVLVLWICRDMKEICCGTFACGFLRPKAVIVADNVLKPGSPLFLWLITRRASSGGRYARCTDNLWHWCETTTKCQALSSIALEIFQPSRVASSLAEWFRTFFARDARFKTEIHSVGELHGARLWPFSHFQLQCTNIF